jgi:N-alpha-acetyl-L-2,4-diaminobutyrate deacetylase
VRWTSLRAGQLPGHPAGFGAATLTVGTVGPTGPDLPSVTISAMLHGDEDAGLLVIHELIEQLGVAWRATGTIHLVPVANLHAALARRRTGPMDGLDANRVGRGHPTGQVTEAVVDTLSSFAATSDLVVNLHCYETATADSGVFVDPQDDQVRRAVLRALAVARPSWVMAVPASAAVTSLDWALCERGVPAISLELPRTDLMRAGTLARVVDAVRRLLAGTGVAELLGGTADSLADARTAGVLPPCYLRRAVRTGAMGVWQPRRELGATLRPGDPVGQLSTVPGWSVADVCAPDPDEGATAEVWTLLQTRPREVVRPNDILFAVGREDFKLRREMAEAVGLDGD